MGVTAPGGRGCTTPAGRPGGRALRGASSLARWAGCAASGFPGRRGPRGGGCAVRRGGAGGGRAGGRGLGRRKPERPRRRRQRRPSRLEAWVHGGSGCGRGLRSDRVARLPASPARRYCLEDGAGRMEILMTVSKFASICTMVGAAAARPGRRVPAFEAPPAGLLLSERRAERPRERRAGRSRRGRDRPGLGAGDGELGVWGPRIWELWLGARAWGLRDGGWDKG